MRSGNLAWWAAALWWCLSNTAAAQFDPAPPATTPPAQTAPPATPPPTAPQTASPAQPGVQVNAAPPTFAAPRPSLLEDSTLSISVTIRMGEAEDSGWDDAVRPLGYDNLGPTYGGEVAVEAKLGDGAVWLGGSLDNLNRLWDSDLGDRSGASGVGALFLTTLRFPLSREVEASLRGAAGGSLVLVSMNSAVVGLVAPRLQASVALAFEMGDVVMGLARVGYDFYRTGSVNDYDQNVSLGGFYFSFGVELRQ